MSKEKLTVVKKKKFCVPRCTIIYKSTNELIAQNFKISLLIKEKDNFTMLLNLCRQYIFYSKIF